ncbi:arylsulfatase [Sphingobium phenoxybenzoativorans]|jgi:arylsulfatase A-like enzyme|uniref:Arylsulfatase n=1 Tax=Sphingobium phenoxybenzoativorans TaxID=1592790 RepID=A0A975Q378_9SPHN|nr:arylsulfatase [Sphingobium phenoxybenzoativorans]QUT07198.1 arylsulfatase [Sphingobium phenoxybenzoativorans]
MRFIRRTSTALSAAWLLIALAPGSASARSEPDTRPNVLLIVADDMGYSDLGAFGGEIETPNLDALARRGVRFTGFHTTSACSPTRAMLLTGSDHHRIGLGTMAELLTPAQRGADGYEGYVSSRAATLAERLSAVGYQTLMSGKWHLGQAHGQTPADRGFAHSFALLQGAANHFGADQSEAYRTASAAPDYQRDGKAVAFPTGAYSSDYFTEQMLGLLQKTEKAKPFFAYLAFTAPHWPLQAPPDIIAKYKSRYDAGPAALQAERLERMSKLGIIGPHVTPFPIETSEWDNATPSEREILARKMAIYAAMVDRLDQNVGRVLELLRSQGRLENTLVIFMSDNGPEGLRFDRPINPAAPLEPIAAPLDNSLDNLGSATSFATYGPMWAQVGSTPYRGTKEDMSEGGIHSPAIVAGPGVERGMLSSAFLHVTDVVPTILDISGTQTSPTIAGRAVLAPEGRSWSNLLKGEVAGLRTATDAQGWELFFRRAIRQGNMKAIFQPTLIPILGQVKPLSTTRWELYDLATDPGETRDLASERPDDLKRLIALWEDYAARNGVVLPEAGAQDGTAR